MFEILGHQRQQDLLKALQSRNTVPHAMLFAGPSGIGKRTLARAFATEILSTSKSSQAALFSGESSTNAQRLSELGTHPDLHLVSLEEEKKDISVEQIRELIGKLSLKPYYASSTVAIIDEAQNMSLAASNALLKTLEEPTPGCHIMLVSSAPHRLPATILSRCQQIHFGDLSSNQIAQVLKSRFRDEASKLNLKSLFELADGTLEPLHLESFVDQKTLELSDVPGAIEHLLNIESQLENMQQRVEEVLAADVPLSIIASIAAELANGGVVIWPVLRNSIRQRMLLTNEPTPVLWADLLEKCLKAEQLCKERNLNSTLQLTALFTELAS